MDIKEKLRDHLDSLFRQAPRSRAAYELQEELYANCLEKYEDMVKDGMPEETAFQNVVGSIGNIDELLGALPGNEADDELLAYEADRRARSALVVTISVGLYIMAAVVVLLTLFIGSRAAGAVVFIGLIVAAILCIVPTCMLVYNAYRYPSYKKKEDTMVEDFKEWNNDSKKSKALRGAVSSLLWTVTVAVYLLVSFITFAWAITWIIFIIAACVEAAINLIFRLKEMR